MPSKDDALEWVASIVAGSGDDLSMMIALLELQEAIDEKKLMLYPMASQQAQAYKALIVNHEPSGRVIKVIKDNGTHVYDRIPQFIEANKVVEQVKRAALATKKLLAEGGVMTADMVPPPEFRPRRGSITLMKTGAVRIKSRRNKHQPWKKR